MILMVIFPGGREAPPLRMVLGTDFTTSGGEWPEYWGWLVGHQSCRR